MFAALVASLVLAQGIPLKSGASTDLVTVNAAKSMLVVRGASTQATYSCTATGLATASLYSMQLNAEVGRGFKVQKICVGTSAATAAAVQTATVQRRNAASSGGATAVAEGTASPSVSKYDPADGNWGGLCTITPTLGAAGAVLDGWSWTTAEIGAGTADPSSPSVFCKNYGDESEKAPTVLSGVANGLSVSVTAAGAGGLASGSITIMFTAQ